MPKQCGAAQIHGDMLFIFEKGDRANTEVHNLDIFGSRNVTADMVEHQFYLPTIEVVLGSNETDINRLEDTLERYNKMSYTPDKPKGCLRSLGRFFRSNQPAPRKRYKFTQLR